MLYETARFFVWVGLVASAAAVAGWHLSVLSPAALALSGWLCALFLLWGLRHVWLTRQLSLDLLLVAPDRQQLRKLLSQYRHLRDAEGLDHAAALTSLVNSASLTRQRLQSLVDRLNKQGLTVTVSVLEPDGVEVIAARSDRASG